MAFASKDPPHRLDHKFSFAVAVLPVQKLQTAIETMARRIDFM
jgi:hypothetical protein